MSGKSQGKILLDRLCPDAFVRQLPRGKIYVTQDGNIAWYHINSKEEKGECMGAMTGEQLLNEMRMYFDLFTGERMSYGPNGTMTTFTCEGLVYFFCWDEGNIERDVVTVAKSETRKKRDEAKKREAENAKRKAAEKGEEPPEVWTWDGVSPIVTMDGYLPKWRDVNRDRAAHARAVEDFFALVKEEWTVPVGVTLVVDGPREGMKFIISKGADGNRKVEECGPTDDRVTHGIPEGDQKVAYYPMKYWDQPFCVISEDTDQVRLHLLGLITPRVLNLRHSQRNENGFVGPLPLDHEYVLNVEKAAPLYLWLGKCKRERYSGLRALPPSKQKTLEQKDVIVVEDFVHVNKLYTLIGNLFGSETIRYPITNVLAMITTDGTDFVQGWPYLSMETILYALLEKKEFIGDITEGDAVFHYLGSGNILVSEAQAHRTEKMLWTKDKIDSVLKINLENFQKAIIAAYHRKYKNRKNSGFSFIFLEPGLSLANLWHKIRKGVKQCNPKLTKAHVPLIEIIVYKISRTWWNLLYDYLGYRNMDLVPHPCDGWGWIQMKNGKYGYKERYNEVQDEEQEPEKEKPILAGQKRPTSEISVTTTTTTTTTKVTLKPIRPFRRLKK